MKDYKTNNYDRGYKSSPELVFIAFIAFVLAYLVAGMSVEEISRFFGF